MSEFIVLIVGWLLFFFSASITYLSWGDANEGVGASLFGALFFGLAMPVVTTVYFCGVTDK